VGEGGRRARLAAVEAATGGGELVYNTILIHDHHIHHNHHHEVHPPPGAALRPQSPHVHRPLTPLLLAAGPTRLISSKASVSVSEVSRWVQTGVPEMKGEGGDKRDEIKKLKAGPYTPLISSVIIIVTRASRGPPPPRRSLKAPHPARAPPYHTISP
jgi:hypothetical protein